MLGKAMCFAWNEVAPAVLVTLGGAVPSNCNRKNSHIMSGIPDTVNPLFDVVAFDSIGVAKIIVSAACPLSGAIACCRGFNAGPADLTGVVVPAGSVELPKAKPVTELAPAPHALAMENFCRQPAKATHKRKTLYLWVEHFFGECDRCYVAVYDSVIEHLISVGAALPKRFGDDDCLSVLERRLSRSDTVACWRAAMIKLDVQ